MERFFSLSNLGCDDLVEQFLKNLNVCNLFKVQREISHRNSKENEGEKKLYGENIIYKWMQQMYIYIYIRKKTLKRIPSIWEEKSKHGIFGCSSINLFDWNSDNNKEKEEKERENGIITPEWYHDPSYFLPVFLALFSSIDLSNESLSPA